MKGGYLTPKTPASPKTIASPKYVTSPKKMASPALSPSTQGNLAYQLLTPSAQNALQNAAQHPNPEVQPSPAVSPYTQGKVAYELLSPSAQEALMKAAWLENPEVQPSPEVSPYTQGKVAYELLSPSAQEALKNAAWLENPEVQPSPEVSPQQQANLAYELLSPEAQSALWKVKQPPPRPISPWSPPVLLKVSDAVPAAGAWIRPSMDTLQREYTVEYIGHTKEPLESIFKMDVFPTEGLFVEAVQAAPTVQWTQAMNKRTTNRTNCKNKSCVINLIKTQKSYPKQRNEKTVDKLEQRIVNDEPTEMPIVFQINIKKYWVVAGNTRLDLALIAGKPIQVVLVDIQAIMQRRFEDLPQEDFPVPVRVFDSTLQEMFPRRQCKELTFQSEDQGDQIVHKVTFQQFLQIFTNKKGSKMAKVQKRIQNTDLDQFHDVRMISRGEQDMTPNSLDAFLQIRGASTSDSTLLYEGETLVDFVEVMKKTCDIDATKDWAYVQFPLSNVKLGEGVQVVLPTSNVEMVLHDQFFTVFFQDGYRLDFQQQGPSSEIVFRDTMLAYLNNLSDEKQLFDQERQQEDSTVFKAAISPNVYLDRYANLAQLNVTRMPKNIARMMERFMHYIGASQRVYNDTLRKALEPTQIQFANYDLDAMLATNIVQDFLSLAQFSKQLSAPATVSQRGFSYQNAETWPNVQLKPGNLFTLDSFLSTSTDARVAQNFTNQRPRHSTIYIEFQLDSSVPQIDVNAVLQNFNCKNCGIQSEQEILLVPSIKPRQMFIVTKVEKVTNETLQQTSFTVFRKILLDNFKVTHLPVWKKQNIYFVRMSPQNAAYRSKLLGGKK